MSIEFFNSKAREWDQMVDHNQNKIRKVMDWLPEWASPSILDVGSGTGVMIPFLKERYGAEARITAIDFAENMIKVSKEKHRNYQHLEFIIGDVNTYLLPVEEYELIICYSVFPHFADKEITLKKLHSSLKKDGRLVIFHSQSRQAINNLHQRAGQEVQEDRLPTAEVVARLGQNLGYQIGRLLDNKEMYVVEFIK